MKQYMDRTKRAGLRGRALPTELRATASMELEQ